MVVKSKGPIPPKMALNQVKDNKLPRKLELRTNKKGSEIKKNPQRCEAFPRSVSETKPASLGRFRFG